MNDTDTTNTRPNAWGRWGPEDEAGALNLIGPAQVKRAAGLVRTGEVLRLAQPLSHKTPVPRHRSGMQHFMGRDGGDYAAGAKRPGGFQFAEDTVAIAIEHFFLTPSVAQRVDMGANVQRHHDRVFCELEATRTLGTRGVVAAVAAHEMLQARALPRHWRLVRQRLRQSQYFASAYQACGALDLC